MKLTDGEKAVLFELLSRERPASVIAISCAAFSDTLSATSYDSRRLPKAAGILDRLREAGLVTRTSKPRTVVVGHYVMTDTQKDVAMELLGIKKPDGPKVRGLTESGEASLRVLYRHDYQMYAWEVGERAFPHITASVFKVNDKRHPRTMVAASALKKLVADGYASRPTQRTYNLDAAQRDYVREAYPDWPDASGEAVVAIPYRDQLGPLEVIILRAALAGHAKKPEGMCNGDVIQEIGPDEIATFGGDPERAPACYFLVKRLVSLGAMCAAGKYGHQFSFTADQAEMARRVLGLPLSPALRRPAATRPVAEDVPPTRPGRAVELEG